MKAFFKAIVLVFPRLNLVKQIDVPIHVNIHLRWAKIKESTEQNYYFPINSFNAYLKAYFEAVFVLSLPKNSLFIPVFPSKPFAESAN